MSAATAVIAKKDPRPTPTPAPMATDLLLLLLLLLEGEFEGEGEDDDGGPAPPSHPDVVDVEKMEVAKDDLKLDAPTDMASEHVDCNCVVVAKGGVS